MNFRLVPQNDITVKELAVAVAFLLSKRGDEENLYEALDPGVKRHIVRTRYVYFCVCGRKMICMGNTMTCSERKYWWSNHGIDENRIPIEE